MMSVIDNFIGFINSLSVIDYVLYFAILVLTILIVSLIYLLRTTVEEDDDLLELDDISNNYSGEFDINETISKLADDKNKSNNIELTEYEKEQEEKAIISYDELINNAKPKKINYETNDSISDKISIRKVNLEDLTSDEEEKMISRNVKVISYQHEEEFLQTLKQLQKLLN